MILGLQNIAYTWAWSKVDGKCSPDAQPTDNALGRRWAQWQESIVMKCSDNRGKERISSDANMAVFQRNREQITHTRQLTDLRWTWCLTSDNNNNEDKIKGKERGLHGLLQTLILQNYYVTKRNNLIHGSIQNRCQHFLATGGCINCFWRVSLTVEINIYQVKFLLLPNICLQNYECGWRANLHPATVKRIRYIYYMKLQSSW